MSIFSRRKRRKLGDMWYPMAPLLYSDDFEPKIEYCTEIGINKYGLFYHIQPGQGGGIRYISCGNTDRFCEAPCCERRALFFSKDGRPLFFCRNHYCLYRGETFVDKREKESNEREK